MQIEENQKASYVQDTSAKMVKNLKRYYYICHRSYFPRVIKNYQRHSKNRGSDKIKRACPAMMIVSVGDTVEVKLFSTHLGHNCEIGRMNLTQNDRNQIAGKKNHFKKVFTNKN